ncbi:MAG: hypothetical protein LH480_05635 [Rubrivivax sp.]|nr:hypothetical protein [Rubrivivax sp.]
MTTITVRTPATVRAPRGAAWAADIFAAGLNAWRLAAEGRQQRLATSTRQREAAEVRRLAQQMMAMDSRFAADLFAAADRHER